MKHQEESQLIVQKKSPKKYDIIYTKDKKKTSQDDTITQIFLAL